MAFCAATSGQSSSFSKVPTKSSSQTTMARVRRLALPSDQLLILHHRHRTRRRACTTSCNNLQDDWERRASNDRKRQSRGTADPDFTGSALIGLLWFQLEGLALARAWRFESSLPHHNSFLVSELHSSGRSGLSTQTRQSRGCTRALCACSTPTEAIRGRTVAGCCRWSRDCFELKRHLPVLLQESASQFVRGGPESSDFSPSRIDRRLDRGFTRSRWAIAASRG